MEIMRSPILVVALAATALIFASSVSVSGGVHGKVIVDEHMLTQHKPQPHGAPLGNQQLPTEDSISTDSALRGPKEEADDNFNLPRITIRGREHNNDDDDDVDSKQESSSSSFTQEPHRELQTDAEEAGSFGFASVIQTMLTVIGRTRSKSGSSCGPQTPCGLCEGDCDDDTDCAGIMRCYHRPFPYTEVPGCQGAEKEDSTVDFCYVPPDDAGPDLDFRGGDYCDDGSCGQCQGDCDRNSDCAGRLQCYQRHYSLHPVPGCYGGEFMETRDDFCYLPPAAAPDEVEWVGCGPNDPCQKCRGECQTDDDCVGSLKCMDRQHRFQAVPGCKGGENIEDPINFCYNPIDDNRVDGRSECTRDDPCGWCIGDCDTDDDCAFGLVCFQREVGYIAVPGCKFGEDYKFATDFCVNPYDVPRIDDSDLAVSRQSTTRVFFDPNCGDGNDDSCGLCYGDCDVNSDCQGDLVCWQRDEGDTVPGCDLTANELADDTDYCVDVSALSGSDLQFPDDFFSYDVTNLKHGPLAWAQIDVNDNEWERFNAPSTGTNRCDGNEQSPIDLTYANAPCEETHHIYYYNGNLDTYNAEGAIKYEIEPFRLRIHFDELNNADPPGADPPGGIAGGVTQKDVSHAELMIPSEHAIGGRRYDAEYRVYLGQDSYDVIIGIASVISAEEDLHNPWMEALLQKWEKVDGCGRGNGYTDRNMVQLEVFNMFRSMYFWAYEGSLTTPPCSQIVQWKVFDTPMYISKKQLARFNTLLTDGGPCAGHAARKTIGPNGAARPIQRDSRDSKVWRCTTDDYIWR